MDSYMPLIAIVGSARAETVGADSISKAQTAGEELGRALANHQCRIAVYSSNSDFIEAFVVKGYLAGNTLSKESITCFYPFDADEDFLSLIEDENLLRYMTHPGDDWEVSFYGSFTQIDGILIIGGGSSTLAAGHIALGMEMPLMAIAEFGGAGKKIWEYLAQAKGNQLITENDISKMSRWKSDSGDDCVKTIREQYNRVQNIKREKEVELKKLGDKATLWDEYQSETLTISKRLRIAGPFLFLFIVLFIVGILVLEPDWLFIVVFVLGLAAAGGTGATIRLLAPNPPKVSNWTGILIGVAVGMIFSFLYLIPQFIGETSFLNPDVDRQIGTSRVQFISAMIFAVSVGFGFDFALDQLQQKARQDVSQVAKTPNP